MAGPHGPVATCRSDKRVLGGGYVTPVKPIQLLCHGRKRKTHGASMCMPFVSLSIKTT